MLAAAGAFDVRLVPRLSDAVAAAGSVTAATDRTAAVQTNFLPRHRPSCRSLGLIMLPPNVDG